MGIKRIVDTSFWTDGKVDDFSPEDKYFMLYLLTNPFSTQLGIYEISIKQVAFQMGYSVDAVKVLIDRFENKYGMVLFSPETNEIAIKNFLRHSIIKGGAPVRDCLIKEMKMVKNKDLIVRVFSHIKGSESLNETVKNIIAEYEEKNGTLYYSNEKQNDNENENDNEVSLPYRQRFVDDTQYEQIKSEILDVKGDGQSECEWCGCKTTILHKHHYPIPKRLGGKETVSICSNCHNEFHARERELLGGSFTQLEDGSNEPPKPPKPTKADIDTFFESLWELYPVKKGKGQVSESKRRTLYAIGFEKLHKAIERYLAELKKDADWRKPQNGSTFFNSGYVDYLDENYVPDQLKTGRKEKIPGWFKSEERGFDEDELSALQGLMAEDKKTVANSPELADRAEKLKQSLQGV